MFTEAIESYRRMQAQCLTMLEKGMYSGFSIAELEHKVKLLEDRIQKLKSLEKINE